MLGIEIAPYITIMQVQVKPNIKSLQELIDANIPIDLLDRIFGRVIPLDANGDLRAEVNGRQSRWNLPSDCYVIISHQ